MIKTTKIISFRMPAPDFAALTVEAERRNLSANELAREIVFHRQKEEQRLNTLTFELASLKDEIKELRQDLSVAIKALLITKGATPVTTSEEAEAWVKANLKYVS